MNQHISSEDNRFFDIQDFDPEEHRVGPVGVFAGVRINTVLLLGPTPSITYMYSLNDKRSFVSSDQPSPQTLQLRDKKGQWHTHTFDEATHQTLTQACNDAIRKIIGE